MIKLQMSSSFARIFIPNQRLVGYFEKIMTALKSASLVVTFVESLGDAVVGGFANGGVKPQELAFKKTSRKRLAFSMRG
jgi:hypothetical protein